MIPILIILALLVIVLISIMIKILGVIQDLLDHTINSSSVSLIKFNQIIELLKDLKFK